MTEQVIPLTDVRKRDRIRATVGASVLEGKVISIDKGRLFEEPYVLLNPDGIINCWPIDKTWTITLLWRRS